MTTRLAELEAVVARIEGRVGEIDGELNSLRENAISPEDVARKLAEFEGVLDVMHPAERTTVIQSMIEAVTCGGSDNVIVHFRTHTRAN